MSLEFFSTCTDWPIDVSALKDMIGEAREISRGSFLKHVNREEMDRIESDLGYERAGSRRGLTMAKDRHVGYYRSTLLGCPAVFFVWSAIEFVFTDLGCVHAGTPKMSGLDLADCSYACPAAGRLDFEVKVRKGETTRDACRRRLAAIVDEYQVPYCEERRVRNVW